MSGVIGMVTLVRNRQSVDEPTVSRYSVLTRLPIGAETLLLRLQGWRGGYAGTASRIGRVLGTGSSLPARRSSSTSSSTSAQSCRYVSSSEGPWQTPPPPIRVFFGGAVANAAPWK